MNLMYILQPFGVRAMELRNTTLRPGTRVFLGFVNYVVNHGN